FEPRVLLDSLGLSLRTLSRQLDLTAPEFYDRFSQSDTHILVGSSFVFDRNHHRLLGDLGASETRPHLSAMIDLAEADTLGSFPATDAQARTAELFARYRRELDAIYAQSPATLAEVYGRWLTPALPDTAITLSSTDMALGHRREHLAALELFTQNYDLAAGLYNRAVADVPLGVHPLDIDAGELPFYAILRRDGRMVRCECTLDAGALCFGEHSLPLRANNTLDVDALQDAGVIALCGKALLLVLQARMLPGGEPLALPDHGSIYMPTAHRFAELLHSAGLLPGGVAPILRVHFHLLDRLGELETPIVLPAHLQRFGGRDTLSSAELAGAMPEWIQTAQAELAACRNEKTLEDKLHQFDPDHSTQLKTQRQTQRRLALGGGDADTLRTQSQAIRQTERELLETMLQRLVDCQQVAELEFYQSRGAIQPWCVAASGEEFYRDVLQRATFTRE
ncbi:MAG: hypothetical protein HN909_04820, partial [Phycisphaerales bacterium]|nr:hypothetical protein [Phycisphaerales bacterium]